MGSWTDQFATGAAALTPVIDGGIADMATIAVGVLVTFFRPTRRLVNGKRPLTTRQEAVTDFLNGATLVPFVLLIGAVFSSSLLKALVESSKPTLAVGGVVGLIFVIGELFAKD